MRRSNLPISTTGQKVESSNAIAANANDYYILDGWNRSYKDSRGKKRTESVTKSPAFLFAAIWLHLAHSCPGLKYMCKAKYKTLGNW